MATGDKYFRTEPPTPKRKKEVREEGRVARSPDVSAWLAILAGSMLAPWLFSLARSRVLAATASSAQVIGHPTVPGALEVIGAGLSDAFACAAITGGAFAALGVTASITQVGRAVSVKAARPRFSRISPKVGLQRLFSPRAGWELAKQVLKLVMLAGISYGTLRGLVTAVGGTSPASLAPLLDYAGSSLLGFMRTVSLAGLALALADYAIQRHRLSTSSRMTKQEVKDERRSQEGDPAVKARLRRHQHLLARSRAITAVRAADVVVANPTHVAIALRYDPSRAGAPRVVAKGVDGLALRIREEARLHMVPIVEDPPLARYLHAVCDVDQQVPVAVYVAVARVIAFVYSLAPGARGIGVHRRPCSIVPEIDPDAPPAAVAFARQRRQALAASRGNGT